ncbi:MAG TPA: maleylpyruvate isomerase family mycothiol-dependent enzyme [Acidimicrobiales bacterium]|nr:maleylpyruvate isomerase family mycothiol-dependent enzyme [Acidimicrobiales bacterium]
MTAPQAGRPAGEGGPPAAKGGDLELVRRRVGWMRAGTAAFWDAAGRLTADRATEPSGLPGWSNAHVLAHVARNADGLCNLLAWARTGVPTPMYAGPAQRDADIAAGSALPLDRLLAELESSSARLDDAVAALPAEAWGATVTSGRGRQVAAAEIPWIRCREVWVHAVDLGTGPTFGDVPPDMAAALLTELAAWAAVGRDAGFEIVPTDGRGPLAVGPVGNSRVGGTQVGGPRVGGTVAGLAAWLSGRSGGAGLTVSPAGPLPALRPWL